MAGGNTKSRGAALGEVAVWDLPTRAFHWCLVLLVAVAVASAEFDRMAIHMLAGEAILALLLFRLAWGLVGSQTARFRSFVKGPRAVLAYAAALRGGAKAKPDAVELGHNPMGALMVVALLLALLVQASTGLFTSDDVVTDGPLVPLVSSATVALFSTVHRMLANGIFLLVGMHVVAVLVYLVIKKENLIRPMVTGRKPVPAGAAVAAPKRAPTAVALAILAAAAGLVAVVVAQGG